ncbi:MAG: SPOR domain-containing protein [Gammaproteobacteria bacterium]|nr:SPOR domain-containing protein [Gammaproteobacteria bacterium]MBQ0839498.1 SPOR domain-containing protein [Gammaproteobacteria bacterium]
MPGKPLPSPPLAAKPASAASASIVPWLIASITLTLALFSGNYAWHTQQQVETLNLRLDQLEALPATPLPGKLQETGDSLARAEQELLTVKQSQEQLAATLSTLQTAVDANTEQTRSQLEKLEGTLTGLSSHVEEALISKVENEALIAQSLESKAKPATSAGETSPTAKSSDTAVNWAINIASFSDPRAANSLFEKVQKITSKAVIKPADINGKTLHRIRAEGYHSREEAERQALALQAELKLSGLWVSH